MNILNDTNTDPVDLLGLIRGVIPPIVYHKKLIVGIKVEVQMIHWIV